MVIFRDLRKDRRATSPVMGVLLMVAITVLIATAIAGFALVSKVPEHTPQAFIAIEDAYLYKLNTTTYQAVILSHKGGDSFNVTDIKVTIVVNGEILPHGLDALPKTGNPTGFNGLGGVFHSWTGGGPVWDVGEMALINIAGTNKVLKDGDKVTVIIVYKPSKVYIARTSAIVQDLR